MTTYIDHATDSPPSLSAGQDSGLLASLLTLWSLPLSTFEIWISGWASFSTADTPAPSDQDETSQLPVPGELGGQATREIFA